MEDLSGNSSLVMSMRFNQEKEKIKYEVLESGTIVEKEFESPYLARKTLEKLKRSKKCRILAVSGRVYR